MTSLYTFDPFIALLIEVTIAALIVYGMVISVAIISIANSIRDISYTLRNKR